MKFISIANPTPSEGVGFDQTKDLVVPEQGLGLKEILERFVRGESIPVGKQTYYDDLSENEEGFDYEKIPKMDLTEIQELKDVLARRIEDLKPSQPKKILDNNRLTDTDEKQK